ARQAGPDRERRRVADRVPARAAMARSVRVSDRRGARLLRRERVADARRCARYGLSGRAASGRDQPCPIASLRVERLVAASHTTPAPAITSVGAIAYCTAFQPNASSRTPEPNEPTATNANTRKSLRPCTFA